MQAALTDPVQALALLPLGQTEAIERQWLQNTLAWLKSVPPAMRTERCASSEGWHDQWE
jgi:hypothetical protein